MKNKIIKAAGFSTVAAIIWSLGHMLNASEPTLSSQHGNPPPGVIIPIIGLLIVFYLVHKNRIIPKKQPDRKPPR